MAAEPIPEGYRSLTPSLGVDDAEEMEERSTQAIAAMS
jgi:hypothetical protein